MCLHAVYEQLLAAAAEICVNNVLILKKLEEAGYPPNRIVEARKLVNESQKLMDLAVSGYLGEI